MYVCIHLEVCMYDFSYIQTYILFWKPCAHKKKAMTVEGLGCVRPSAVRICHGLSIYVCICTFI